MATAVDDTYSAESGATIYGGREGPSALPAWVPEPGTFADISLNTMYDVRPEGWPNSDIAGPFLNWSGGVFNPDFSALGALVIHGSGHLASGSPVWAGNWCFDLDNLAWVGRNVPGPLNAYGESTDPASLGHTYAPHTYDGLVMQPAALGGGPKGSLIRASMAGAPFGVPVHRFDLSSAVDAPGRVIDNLGGDSYPAAALDAGRGGFWYLDAKGTGPLKFVSFSDWSATQYSGVEFGEYGSHNLVYIPAPWDCLLSLGDKGTMGAAVYSMRVCPIVGDVPQGFSVATYSGTPVPDTRAGGCWSTLLERVVCMEGYDSTTVHQITPPDPGELLSGTWAWSTESLTGVGGATVGHAINTNNGLPFANNGTWSRFVEAPAARCFLWCQGINKPVQAWRLTGM